MNQPVTIAARNAIVEASARLTEAKLTADTCDVEDIDAARSCIEAGLFLFDAITRREGNPQHAHDLVQLATRTIREIAA